MSIENIYTYKNECDNLGVKARDRLVGGDFNACFYTH